MTELRSWIDARTPSVPRAFRPWMGATDVDAGCVTSLAHQGLSALEAVDAAKSLDRDAALRLLAADAFLTYACEAATDEADVVSSLESVLERLAVDATR